MGAAIDAEPDRLAGAGTTTASMRNTTRRRSESGVERNSTPHRCPDRSLVHRRSNHLPLLAHDSGTGQMVEPRNPG
jgi:hypothetical protein